MDPKIDIDNDTNSSDNEEVVLEGHSEPNTVEEEPWWYPMSEPSEYDGQ